MFILPSGSGQKGGSVGSVSFNPSVGHNSSLQPNVFVYDPSQMVNTNTLLGGSQQNQATTQPIGSHLVQPAR